MATPGDWEPRRREKMLSLYAADLLSPAELIGSLLGTFTAGQMPPSWPPTRPPFGADQGLPGRVSTRPAAAGVRVRRLDPDEADRWYRERQASTPPCSPFSN